MRRMALLSACAIVASATPALASARVFFGGDVIGLYRQRPASIHITSDQNIGHIKWSSWGGATAKGKGTYVYSKSDMTAPEPVSLTFSHIKRCGSRRLYLKLSLTFTARPRGVAHHSAGQYTCKSPQ